MDCEYLNQYRCPECSTEWTDVWDCAVDDDCPECGERHITAYKSELLAIVTGPHQ